jgi:hypothetical protein
MLDIQCKARRKNFNARGLSMRERKRPIAQADSRRSSLEGTRPHWVSAWYLASPWRHARTLTEPCVGDKPLRYIARGHAHDVTHASILQGDSTESGCTH